MTAATEMTALRAHARGGAEQLVLETAPVPALRGPDEVLVRVTAAAVTLDELTWPETWESNGQDRTPIIPSHEFAGTVAAIGDDVRGLAVGDRVYGLVPFDRDGAAAEYTVVPVSSLAVLPAGVADEVAAAAVLPGLTAWEALSAHLDVPPGGRLLVRGGSGAVGMLIIQLAAQRGIEVTATVRREQSAARAFDLGAAAALIGDEPEALASAAFDASIDTVGAGTPEWMYRAVREGGRVITLQEPPSAELADAYRVDARFFIVHAEAQALADLAGVLAEGRLHIAIARRMPLAAGRAAYDRDDRPAAPGKTVLLPRAD
ncbi:NADP-dependent oxidoreductase [Microbacterium stercoris]|uniref:NADP-dependent oxidoreductase n=1 Tax=Microbacterium stercoris TaxID=2820289 RepID=A0A939TPJ2_9MICO|nr:NADP-dependent oxidoreductase [Microbacterium stercoris]MBO3662131.1 NADP-dependent oxidoreductase [Microbacterium stercoris]